MKRVFWTSIVLTILLISIMAAFAITANAAALPATVVADEGWGNVTYDSTTKELKNGDGGYSFSMTTSGTNATLSTFGVALTATKVVIPYQITCNGTTYTVTAQGTYLLQVNASTANTVTTDVIVSEGITTLSAMAFRSYNNTSKVKGIRLPSTLKTIGGNCFMTLTALTSINIPQGVTTVGGGAFQSTGLSSITFPSSITSFGGDMFYGSTNLTSVVFNFPITSMSGYFFRACTKLTSYDIPDTVTGTLGAMSFSASGISTAIIPVGVTTIDGSAFSSCPNLTSVVCKGTLANINSSAFASDSKLDNVTFKGNVTNIATLAFKDAKLLKSITFEGQTAPVLAADVFNITTGGASEDFTIYYPAAGDNAANYGVGSAFRSSIASTTVASGKTLTVHYVAVQVPTSSTLSNITPIAGGYTVGYHITLGTGITSSKNLVALYNGNDLVAVQSVASNATSVDFITNKTITKARAFVWDDIATVKPLCASPELLAS